ncbi:unnamed protein product, partial [Rangifer tarandus platyrhynchus]
MTRANNSIFREMILLFMKKECFELLYWNFSACNVEGMYYLGVTNDLWSIYKSGSYRKRIVLMLRTKHFKRDISYLCPRAALLQLITRTHNHDYCNLCTGCCPVALTI